MLTTIFVIIAALALSGAYLAFVLWLRRRGEAEVARTLGERRAAATAREVIVTVTADTEVVDGVHLCPSHASTAL